MSLQASRIEYDKSEGRALRLLELYFCIEENPGIKADELVEKFDISPASLYLDIQSLKKMGITIGENIETEYRSWVQSFGSKARIVGIDLEESGFHRKHTL